MKKKTKLTWLTCQTRWIRSWDSDNLIESKLKKNQEVQSPTNQMLKEEIEIEKKKRLTRQMIST